MKIAKISILISLAAIVAGLEVKPGSDKRICWHCSNSRSDEHCFMNGYWKQCEPNEFCYVEKRIENGIERHLRGCKQDASCDSLIMQNQIGCSEPAVTEFQKTYPHQPLVCRHCCFVDYCNPTAAMNQTTQHLLSFRTNKDRSIFLRGHRASFVRSIKARKPKEREIYYPGFGWIQWPVGAFSSGLAFPPFKTPANGRISEEVMVKKTAVHCPERSKLQKTPSFLNIKNECVVKTPETCVKDGTMVFKIKKMTDDEIEKDNIKRKNAPQPICPRTPTIETVMVYDEGDHYVMVARFRHRIASHLAAHKRGKFFVGENEITDYYTWQTIKNFRTGRG